MSNEPPNDADELLKAYARQRQADGGDPLELHPATRRMLQGEVARTIAAGARREPVEAERAVPIWRRYLFVGSSALAVLVGGIYAVKVWVAPMSNGPEQMALLQKQAFPAAETSEDSPRRSGAFVKSGEKVADEAEMKSVPKQAMGDTTLAIVDGLAPAGERKSALDLNETVTMSGGTAVAMKSASSLGDERKVETGAPETVKLAYTAAVPAERQVSLGANMVTSGAQLVAAPAASPANPVDRVSELGASQSRVALVSGTTSAPEGTGALTRATVMKEMRSDAEDARKQTERDAMLKDSSLRAEVVAAATKSKAAVADLAGGITVNGGTLAVSAGREMQSTSALPRLGADNTYTGAAALGGGAPLSAPIPASSPASATAAPPVVMSPVPASPAQPAAPPVADVERAAVGGRAPAGVQTWNFVQTEDRTRLRRNFNSPPPVNILNSFQFEHSGDVVRVVDEDGSIYTGSIGTDKSAINGRVGGGVNELTKKAEAAPVAQQVYFHVTGTNRSLKQPVVFDGSLTWPAAAVLPNQDAFKTATGTAATNAQLQGRVRVGTRMQMDINAVPSTR